MKLPLLPKVVVVDTNFLIVNADPKTSEDTRHRITHIFATAEKTKTRIIFPMPAIAEYLVQADEGALNILNVLEKKLSYLQHHSIELQLLNAHFLNVKLENQAISEMVQPYLGKKLKLIAK